MTDAVYSTGNEFHYEYDSVGNILTKTMNLNGVTTTTTYTYDDANRLQTVNGIVQQFDANGNLINDGTKAYAYDSANRLKTITQGSNVSSYAYTGLGDRVSQTNNGVTTSYSLDLNAGLTQVLSDGTNTYLYGLGRIGEQQPSGFAYHLGDALGSVRQLVDASGVVQLTRSYEPYGETLSSFGSANSVYQYTGEARDASGLQFNRARYYASLTGRFLSHDLWEGNAQMPMSYNNWAYAYGNVINLMDSSGLCSLCQSGSVVVVSNYGVNVRSKPSTKAERLTTLTPNTKVTINETLPIYGDGHFWHSAKLPGFDQDVWMANEYLNDIPKPNPNVGLYPSFYDNPVPPPYDWMQGFGAIEFAYQSCDINPKDPDPKGCYYKNASGLRHLHNGIDFGVPEGTPVSWTSSTNGVVKGKNTGDADPNLMIQVGEYYVVFGHLLEDETFKKYKNGDIITPGTLLGHSGKSDNDSPHLHLGVRHYVIQKGKETLTFFDNPVGFFNESSIAYWTLQSSPNIGSEKYHEGNFRSIVIYKSGTSSLGSFYNNRQLVDYCSTGDR